MCEERMDGRSSKVEGKPDDITFLLLRNLRR